MRYFHIHNTQEKRGEMKCEQRRLFPVSIAKGIASIQIQDIHTSNLHSAVPCHFDCTVGSSIYKLYKPCSVCANFYILNLHVTFSFDTVQWSFNPTVSFSKT